MTLEACWRGLYRVNITYARYLYGNYVSLSGIVYRSKSLNIIEELLFLSPGRPIVLVFESERL